MNAAKLQTIYQWLLELPPDDPFRIRNQRLLATIRDEFANAISCEPEIVQTYMERFVASFKEKK